MVVPAILQKLPEAFCLTIRREADFLNWSMGELLSAFLNKLEQREDHDYAISSGGNPQNRKDSNTFYIKQEVKNCAFCLRRHAPANCKKVDARKNILVKYGRFFKKGDMEPEIVSQLNYVTSVGICDKQVKPAVSKFEVRPEANLLQIAQVVFMLVKEIALQTIRLSAVITGEGQLQRVRVLFDAGSHRYFVTARVVQLAWLNPCNQARLACSIVQLGKAQEI